MDDSRGLSVSGADSESISAVEKFRQGLLAMEGGLDGIVEAARRAPGCALLQIYATIFFLYAGTRSANEEAASWLGAAEEALQGVKGRERKLFDAVHSWLHDDLEAAMQRFRFLQNALVEARRLHIQSWTSAGGALTPMSAAFTHLKQIGAGCGGTVKLARRKADNKLYALKELELPRDPQEAASVLQETHILASLDHPFIVRYYDAPRTFGGEISWSF